MLRRNGLKDGAGEWDKARLEGVAAPHAGAWLDAPPSRAQDMRMTNPEISSRVGRRLGAQICEERACPFCFATLDKWGAHAECCMSGGDKTAAHHCVRNRVYTHSKNAGAIPVLEAAGVLDVLAIQDSHGIGREAANHAGHNRERPADVLLCRAQDIRVGSGGGAAVGRVALDIGIVCPQAAVHLSAAQSQLGAAESYTLTKCSRAHMEDRCRAAGVVFQPLIFESLGGVSIETECVIKCLNRMVAENQDSSPGDVATRFWQRLSVDIQRAGHRAFVRRALKGNDLEGDGLQGLLCAGAFLVEPGGL